MNISTQRYHELCKWLASQIPWIRDIEPLAGDASFRHYFRVHTDKTSLVAMDAPPDKEDSRPFVRVAQVFKRQGLCVPDIIAQDLERGFLLLSDFGDELYFRCLNPQNAEQLYLKAMTALLTIQTCQQSKDEPFPLFDRQMLMEELSRFREWYLLKHLGLELSEQEENVLNDCFSKLVDMALIQPQICVHRDYHSRNLLWLENNEVGILDFQDAVWGPVTYDLVSLLRDCYIAWPKNQVVQWAFHYYEQAIAANILFRISFEQFIHWFDWMGIQRHLKAIYIFARKFRRDANAAYLSEIPRVLQYIVEVSSIYPELFTLKNFLENRVLHHEGYDFSSGSWEASATINRQRA